MLFIFLHAMLVKVLSQTLFFTQSAKNLHVPVGSRHWRHIVSLPPPLCVCVDELHKLRLITILLHSLTRSAASRA